MALANLFGIGNTIKKSIESAKAGNNAAIPKKKSAKEALAEIRTAKKPSAKEALAQLRSQNTNSNTPRPLGEVLGATDAFKKAQEKSLQEGKFNIEDQRRAFLPVQDMVMEDATSTVGMAGSLIGKGLEATGNVIKDIPASIGNVAKTAGDVGNSVVAAGQQVANDPLGFIGNVAKAPFEFTAGAIERTPEAVANVAKAGLDAGNFVSKALPLPQDLKNVVSKGVYDTGKLLDKGNELMKAQNKPVTSVGGFINPDSLAGKAGGLALDTLLSTAGAKAGGFGKPVLQGSGSLGSKIINAPKETGPLAEMVRNKLNKLSKTLPETVNMLKDSAIATGAAAAVNNGRLPTPGELITSAVFDKYLNTAGKKQIKDARYKYMASSSIGQATKESEDRFNSIVDRMMDKGLSANNADDFKGLMKAEYKESSNVFKKFLNENDQAVTSNVNDFVETALKDETTFSRAKAKAIKDRLATELEGRSVGTLKDVDKLVQYANKELSPYLSGARQITTDSATDVQMYQLLRDWGKGVMKDTLPDKVYQQRYRSEIAKRALDAYENTQRALSDQISGQAVQASTLINQKKSNLKDIVRAKESFGKGTTTARLKRFLGKQMTENPAVKVLARKPLNSLAELIRQK